MVTHFPQAHKKRVLITGLTGFTGQYVKQEFLAYGWEVFGLGTHPSDPSQGYFQVSLLDVVALRTLLAELRPHAVVHLAGIAFAAHRQPADFYTIHVVGTLNLLAALEPVSGHLQKVLLASSANVYGNTLAGTYHENAVLQPFNDYGVSKLAMEYMAGLWRDKLPLVITRPFNYTGVGQAQHFLLPKIIDHFKRKTRRIELGNLHVRRDYSDVRNVAQAYRRLIECPEATGAINICSGTAYSVRDVLDIITTLTGHDMEIVVNPDFVRAGEVELLVGSHDKLHQTIGSLAWIPLSDTLQWMLSAPL